MSFLKKLVVISSVIIFWTQLTFAVSPELLWQRRYDGGSKEWYNSDFAYGVATDRKGNIIVTGSSESNYLTIKYDSNGNVLWRVPYDSGKSDTAHAVAVDSLNNIIVVGSSTAFVDWYIVKYDEGGKKIWSTTLNMGRTDIAEAVSVDSNDNIIVTGYCTAYGPTTGDTLDYFTLKYDSNGKLLWYAQYNLWDDRAHDVTVDSKNSVIVTGTSDKGSDPNIHTIKYDSNGKELWSRDFNSGYKDYGYGVTTDSADNVIVVGYSYDSSATGRANCVILKYDSYGNELWRRTYSRSTFDYAYCITADHYDNIILGGASNGSLNIVIYDPKGNLLWEYNYSNFVGNANSVYVDANNDIVVAGTIYSTETIYDFQTMKFRGYGSTSPTTTTTIPTTTTSTTTTTVPTTTTTTTTKPTTTTTTTTIKTTTTTSTTTTTKPTTTTTTSTTTTTLPPYLLKPVENLEARRVDDTFILNWDASSTYDLQGYNVYYDFASPEPPYNGTGAVEGNSGELIITKEEFNAAKSGDTKKPQLTFRGLPEGTIIYVAVTAVDYKGNESDYSDVVIPSSVSINKGAGTTTSIYVYLYLTYCDKMTQMSISKNGVKWSDWIEVRHKKRTRLSSSAGEKTVYVKFRSNYKAYEPVMDTIILGQ